MDICKKNEPRRTKNEPSQMGQRKDTTIASDDESSESEASTDLSYSDNTSHSNNDLETQTTDDDESSDNNCHHSNNIINKTTSEDFSIQQYNNDSDDSGDESILIAPRKKKINVILDSDDDDQVCSQSLNVVNSSQLQQRQHSKRAVGETSKIVNADAAIDETSNANLSKVQQQSFNSSIVNSASEEYTSKILNAAAEIAETSNANLSKVQQQSFNSSIVNSASEEYTSKILNTPAEIAETSNAYLSKVQQQSFNSSIVNSASEEDLHVPEVPDESDLDKVSLNPRWKSPLIRKSVNIGANKNYRISENIKFAMSSTMVESCEQPEVNQESTDSSEVQIISPSKCISDDIEIISDSDDEVFTKPNIILKQTTLDGMLKTSEIPPKQILPKSPELASPKTTFLKVSANEYKHQKDKVLKFEYDFQKSKNLLRTINLHALPDKGDILKAASVRAANMLRTETEKLNSMIIEKKLNIHTAESKVKVLKKQDPTFAMPVSSSWKDIKAASVAVQPRTFGKQALATHNQQKTVTMDRLHQLHGSLKTCPAEETIATDPKGLKVELMQHQRHALAWLLWREKEKPSGGILADDMGLGKTLTMISLVMKSNEQKECNEDSDEENHDLEKRRHKFTGGTLVVCPASLLSQWDGEIRNRVRKGLISSELYHGPKRESKAKILAKNDFVITTYAIVMHEMGKSTPLFTIKWDRIVMDEAHQVRNYKSRTSLAVCELAAKSRWALTGTPIHNKEVDLYALLKFLRCSPFDDLAIFKRWATEKNSGGQERLHTVMSSVMLRRTKAQLQESGSLQCLPERSWDIIEIKLEKQEMYIYEKVLIFSKTLFAQFLHQRAEKNQDEINSNPLLAANLNQPNNEYQKMHKKVIKMNGGKQIKQHEILVLLLRLRQICCHPSLITGMLQDGELEGNARDDDDENIDALDLLEQLNKLKLDDEDDLNITNAPATGDVCLAEATRGILNPSHPVFNKRRRSTKVKAVIKLLTEIPRGDKCIIVSQWTGLLKLLCVHLEDECIVFDQLDGTVPVHKRAILIENFNDPQYPAKVLLLSLTAGGVGLNLIGANHLLLLDLHWNPQLEMQAQDRIYRVGQKKHVHVYKFMALDTIEERIKNLQDHKKNIAESLLTGSKMKQTKLSLDDLKMLFGM